MALSLLLFALVTFDQVNQFSFSDPTWRLAVGAVVIPSFNFVLRMLHGHFAEAAGGAAAART